jgi:hypothetical protein
VLNVRVIDRAANTIQGAAMWNVECLECANTFAMHGYNLRDVSKKRPFRSCPKCYPQYLKAARARVAVGNRERRKARPRYVKVCWDCGSQPWRVDGASCLGCGLIAGAQPALELETWRSSTLADADELSISWRAKARTEFDHSAREHEAMVDGSAAREPVEKVA